MATATHTFDEGVPSGSVGGPFLGQLRLHTDVAEFAGASALSRCRALGAQQLATTLRRRCAPRSERAVLLRCRAFALPRLRALGASAQCASYRGVFSADCI